MSGPLFIELSSCIIGTVMELLSIDYMVQQGSVDIIVLTNVTALLNHTAMVYILCFYAEKYTTQSFQMTHSVYSKLLWYNLPFHQQKIMILNLCRSQKPVRLDGLGIFIASMETFLKVYL